MTCALNLPCSSPALLTLLIKPSLPSHTPLICRWRPPMLSWTLPMPSRLPPRRRVRANMALPCSPSGWCPLCRCRAASLPRNLAVCCPEAPSSPAHSSGLSVLLFVQRTPHSTLHLLLYMPLSLLYMQYCRWPWLPAVNPPLQQIGACLPLPLPQTCWLWRCLKPPRARRLMRSLRWPMHFATVSERMGGMLGV